MKGSLVKRGKNLWSLVFDLGYELQADGKRKRKQKWVSFHGTKPEAEVKLTELVRSAHRNEFVEPSKVTLIQWLETWLEKSIKPPLRRPETYRTYGSIIEKHIKPSPIANIPLQRLQGADLERYYADSKAAPSSLSVHHALLHRALKKAVKDRLLHTNPAVDLDRRRATADHGKAAREHCWTAVEARLVLETAKKGDAQMSTFIHLALDTGARADELHGLTWADVDLTTGVLTISRQLDKAGVTPVWGPTKTKQVRTLTLGTETVTVLRAHKQAQEELKMRNATYAYFGLIFAKEPGDLQTPNAQLGQPMETLSKSRFHTLLKTADVKRIKFHGVRHTVATLSLQAGTLPHVVAARLGHSVIVLMKTYAHAMPDQQQDAAARLASLLHG